MITRRTTMMAGGAALAWSGPGRAQPALQKFTMTHGGDAMHNFPVYVARGAGFFAEEGLEVDWVNVNSGTRQAASVMGGSAEMSPMALFHVLKSNSEGGNLVAIMPIFDVYGMTLVLSNKAMAANNITPDTPIDDKVRRLRGLKIGISSPGSSTDALVRSLFLARGMDPDKEVQLLPIGNGPALLAAFERGLCDGFVYTAPQPEIVAIRKLGASVVDPFRKDVPELVDVPYVVMVTNKATLSQKPALIRGAVRAITRGMRYAYEKPEETRAIMRRAFPSVDQQAFDMAVDTYRMATPHSPVITPGQVTKTLAWMNLGVAHPITARYEDVVAVEPARTAAAELLKS